MKFTFDRVLNVLLLLVLAYGIYVVRPAPQTRPPVYAAGEIVPAIVGAPYSEAERTAVLFVRSTCHFCTESMGFYRELAKEHRVIAISGEPLSQLEAYLNENALFVPRVQIPRGQWTKLSGTPTIVVVDNTGHVVKSWVGSLSPSVQQDVKASLN